VTLERLKSAKFIEFQLVEENQLNYSERLMFAVAIKINTKQQRTALIINPCSKTTKID
jgi:hypothetical protein